MPNTPANKSSELNHLKFQLKVRKAADRILGRALAMHHTSELQDVINTFGEQLQSLELDITGGVFISINDEIDRDLYVWGSGGTAHYGQRVRVPFYNRPIFTGMINHIKNGSGLFLESFTRNQKTGFFKHLFKYPPYNETTKAHQKEVLSREGGYTRAIYTSALTSVFIINHHGRQFSEKDHQVLILFAEVFEQGYRRFLDLQKAEAQASEAQIEAALERVRSASMAMHKSEDLNQVIATIFHQLQSLGFEAVQCEIALFDPITNDCEIWPSNETENVLPRSYRIPYTERAFYQVLLNAWKSKTDYNPYQLKGRIKSTYEKWLFTQTDWKDIPQSVQDSMREIKLVNLYWATTKHGILEVGGEELISAEQFAIIKRFANVFEQSYTRFLDIKKAEAQAREARIEVALERVRTKTMAMRRSDELSELIVEFYKELTQLDLQLDRCMLLIVDSETKDITWWLAGKEGLLDDNGFTVRNNRYKLHKAYLDGWQKRRKKWQYFLGGDEKKRWDNYAFTKTDLSRLPPIVKRDMSSNESIHLFLSSDRFGHLLTGSFEPLSDEQQDIISRFATAFNLTYTRFQDLQKAEAQTREAQIEIALERVRSRTMAMHHSKELREVASVLYQQVGQLGLADWGCNIQILDSKNKTIEIFLSESEHKTFDQSFYFRGEEHPGIKAQWDNWRKKRQHSTIHLKGRSKRSYDNYLFKHTDFIFLPEKMKSGIRSLNEVHFNFSRMRYGFLVAISMTSGFKEEEFDILDRFAKVFEQTYTRFLDLQKAEEQAREAQIEAALEKVRSRTMAMQKSDELKEVIQLVFEQFVHLNIFIEHTGFIMDYKDREDMLIWLADPKGVPALVSIPYFDSPHWNSFIEAREKGTNFFANHLTFEEKNKFYKQLFTYIPGIPEKAKKQYLGCPGLAISTVLMDNVGLYIENFSGSPYSDEENDTLFRFGKVFQQTYTRFLDLQKAEAQAREAQIEAALERIRAKSMAMHQSQNLRDVVQVMYEQLNFLGLAWEGISIVLCHEERDELEYWFADVMGLEHLSGYLIKGRKNYYIRKFWSFWKNGVTGTIQLEGDKKWRYDTYLLEETDFKTAPEELKQAMRREKSVCFTIVPFKYGFLEAVNTQQLRAPEVFLLGRFALVFEQAYTRFLDLKKAEEQAREAQIEAALERTRTQSMMMQHSRELDVTARVFHEQLLLLGIETEFSYVWLPDVDQGKHMFWATFPAKGQDGQELQSKSVNYDLDREEPYTAACFAAWESDEPVHVNPIHPEEVRHFFDTWSELLKGAKNLKAENFPEGLYYAEAYMKYGCFGINIRRLLSVSERQILGRFAIEFERTYTRFLDLQKAEEQAREAQIESALERVRGQVNRMEKSEDLLDIVVAMRKEFVLLGNEAHYFWHMRWLPEKYQKAMTSGDGTRIGMVMELPRRIHGEIKLLADWEKSDEPTVIFPMDVEATLDYVHKMGTWGDFEHIDPNMPSDDDIRHIGGLTYIMARTSLGEIGYSLPGMVTSVPQEHLDILVRFARAFDLAHKRFEDLKISEQQTRETQIELALEKVRSRTMAMQRSDELPEAANLLFLQIQALGIPAWSAGYCIWDNEDHTSATAFMSSEGVLQKPFSLPTKGVGYNFYDPLQRGESFYVEELGGEVIVKHYEFMRTLPVFGEVIDGIIAAGFPLPTFQIFHIVFFPEGYLMFITYEQVPDAHDIFKRFAKVFEQTYTRFLDLQKTEKQADLIKLEKERLEKTLSDLQATQKQLIHAEKMASLGELTAGIAHEIQNPLNFVNNFSEVSNELIEEMNEEIEKGDLEEAKAISTDIKQNLEKILHHGKRADDIVKGMLQHSRSSSGEKEPTDINALADEYLRLAYHGLRAKDKSFNAEMVTDLDKSLPMIKIAPQEIGRVILNLITNAFHAVNEKRKAQDNGDYKPKVTVATKKTAPSQEPVPNSHREGLEGVQISVTDNGGGIPDNIKDKIFQPFFTTKPTGQGTGLGLSLSYDIIKAHGGEISVHTEPERGTTFNIIIPIT